MIQPSQPSPIYTISLMASTCNQIRKVKLKLSLTNVTFPSPHVITTSKEQSITVVTQEKIRVKDKWERTTRTLARKTLKLNKNHLLSM